MAKSLKPDQVRAILESGLFDEFVGGVEDEHLECKAAPYQVQHDHQKHDHQKQELAKDVAAFANTDGGIILIGAKTQANPMHLGDEITEICPFLQTLVDAEQWQAILRSWVYPPIQHVDIQWFPSAENPTRGLIAIDIPTQATAQHPFLVTRTIDNQGKRIEVVFGYMERRRAYAVPLSVVELQILLRYGFRYDLLHQQLEDIQVTLQGLQAERYQEVQQSARQNIAEVLRERMEQSLKEVGLQNQPVFILAATPTHHIEITDLFTSKDTEIVRLLEYPPELRRYGFDLNTGARAQIVRGQLRRSVDPEDKLLELWFDGTLIFIVRGDGNFLSWGKHTRSGDPLRLNQLALIESTYLFSELSKQVSEQAQPRPRGIRYQLELRNMTVRDTACGLIPGPLGTFDTQFGTDIRRAPDANAIFTINWEEPEINPRAVAFLLVSKVYEWFGIEHEHIPYTERVDNRLTVSPEHITRLVRTYDP